MPRRRAFNAPEKSDNGEDYFRAKCARASARLLDLLCLNHAAEAPEAVTRRADEYAKPIEVPEPTPEETEEARIASWLAKQFEQPKLHRPWNDTGKVHITKIQGLVCQTFGISRLDLVSQRRTKNIAIPRHIAAFLSRKLTSKSLPQIGQAFGGRDHTTILNSIRWVECHTERDAKLASQIDALSSALVEAL